MNSLIKKYNVPGPRYTSYPTVPFWKNEQLSSDEWLLSIQRNLDFFQTNKVSIYIHLPFCESLCTFCGCHKRITKNHQVEKPYIDSLIEEWNLYQEKFDFEISEIHLGGGTPTFFKASELKRLIENITKNSKLNSSEIEFSFEAHPNNTTKEHLETLYNLGFKRLSFGVQDYNETVQKAINRIQSIEQVTDVHLLAKNIGYKSISHDLVFGLPKQQIEGFKKTVLETINLKPERVSLYSYAHVPWIKGNGQRGFEDSDLPDNEEKRGLYEMAKDLFLAAGYIEIGMDHFALPEDDLAVAFKNKSLHRNFMGYTTQKTNLLIGLGVSSISDSWFCFAQNNKSVEEYQDIVSKGEIPVFRGHLLNTEDLILRKCILDLMCHFETTFPKDEALKNQIIQNLQELIADNLVQIDENKISVPENGIPFIRNICMAFDTYLATNKTEKQLFSKTI